MDDSNYVTIRYPEVPNPLCAYELIKLGWKTLINLKVVGDHTYDLYPIGSSLGNILQYKRNDAEYFLIVLELGYKHGYIPDPYHIIYPVWLGNYPAYHYNQADWQRQGGVTIYHVYEGGNQLVDCEGALKVHVECADGLWNVG